MKLEFVGEYRWRAGETAFLDIESIALEDNGTYRARVEATLVNPSVRSFSSRCMLPETGEWSAYDVIGQARIRLRPSTSKARVYVASLEDGVLSLARRGTRTTLHSEQAAASARCA